MTQPLSSPDVDATIRDLRSQGCGRAVGRYTLLRRLAAGGMAEVYVARSHGFSGFEKKVAIKKILPQHAHNERFISMLEDEARITVGLAHPNIAQVFEFGHDGEDYFLVMEYVDGRPLNRLMQRVDERGLNVIPIEHAVQVMIEVAKGLDYAHKRTDEDGRSLQIVHRDVSPQNVLITWQGDVKLIDFGIARAEGRSHQTSHGVIKGKLRYLAPEIAMGEEPDHRADVFCCGIVLFEMLTGEAMFAPKTDLEAIELATQAKVKSPRARNPKVPQALDDIVLKALARDRDQRYGSAKELAAELKTFLSQAYPSYLGSELGDLMGQMFVAEIDADRRLDRLADEVATEISTEIRRHQEDEPTQSARPDSIIGPTPEGKRYRQLVTRYEIAAPDALVKVKVGGADGGRAMEVVPASGEVPARRRMGAGPPITLPPMRARLPGDDQTGPLHPAEPRLRSDTVDVPGLEVKEVDAAQVVAPPRTSAGSRPFLLVPLAGLILAATLTYALTTREEIPTLDPVGVQTEEGLVPSGELEISVRPVVPISVEVDGVAAASNQDPPVLIERLVVDQEYTFRIHAEGYEDLSFVRRVRSAERETEVLALKAATAAIELVGPGMRERPSIRSNRGVVRGHRIEEIPLDTEVEIEIDFGYGRERLERVFVKDVGEVRVAVAPPPRLPNGTLRINARPRSLVYVEGRKVGFTPKDLRLPPGRYEVKLVHPDGEAKTFVQRVMPARTKTFTHRW